MSLLKVISNRYRLISLLLLVIFFVNGLVWNSILPIWEGPDETSHFSYIQYIIEEKQLPSLDKTQFTSKEVTYSLRNLPTNHHAGTQGGGNYTSYSSFWHAPNNTRAQIIKEDLKSLSDNNGTKEYYGSVQIYEVQQAPLYYLVASPIYSIVAHQDLITKVFVLRTFSIALATIGIFIAHRTIRLITNDHFVRYGSLIFMTLNPMFTINFVRISNESLTMLLFSIFLYYTVRFLKSDISFREKIIIGIIVGFGILSKVTFVVVIPLIIILIFMKWLQRNQKTSLEKSVYRFRIIKDLVIIYSIPVVIGGWWYIRNKITTGDFTGLAKFNALKQHTFEETIKSAINLPWVGYYHEFFVWFWGRFGWELIRLPTSYYDTFYIISIISFIGLLVWIFRKRREKSRLVRFWKYQVYVFLGVTVIMLILGISYENLIYSMSSGSNAAVPEGWYTFIGITAISILFMVGFRSYITKFSEKAILPFFTIMFLFNFSILFYLAHSYYWGIYWGI